MTSAKIDPDEVVRLATFSVEREFFAIDHHAGLFHLGNDRNQWAVDHLIDPRRLFRGHAQAQNLPQTQGNVGIFGGIFGCFVERHFGKANRFLARTGERFKTDTFMTEMQLAELVHAVSVKTRVKIETHHQRVVKWGDPNVMLGQHGHIIFEILSNFQNRVILKQRP